MRIREEDLPLRLLARVITPQDLQFIRSLITENPEWNRDQLALEICRAWSWNKPSGDPKDISAKQLLIRLDESGLISRCHRPGTGAPSARALPALRPENPGQR